MTYSEQQLYLCNSQLNATGGRSTSMYRASQALSIPRKQQKQPSLPACLPGSFIRSWNLRMKVPSGFSSYRSTTYVRRTVLVRLPVKLVHSIVEVVVVAVNDSFYDLFSSSSSSSSSFLKLPCTSCWLAGYNTQTYFGQVQIVLSLLGCLPLLLLLPLLLQFFILSFSCYSRYASHEQWNIRTLLNGLFSP